MNADAVRKLLGKAIEDAGSLRKWAAENDVSPAFVSDVMRGNRAPSDKILAPLGLVRKERKEIEYERIHA